ncbi:protein-tyrosine-phosphatase MKP1-like isoform X2 [Coffea arabica]|uniref:Protein-tyrosine-phosphatase MKP1-like isoform X2 n=1 Tax=Coffea arabica TaxID=13443 RepID=A0ABM4WS99_COFAR
MVGKEDAPSGGEGGGGCEGGLQRPYPVVGGRKLFWRSASWSSSRTTLPPLNPYSEKDGLDPPENANGNGQGRRVSGPLTPRSQNSFKNRSCLPPLQPLSIARRSLDDWPKAGSDDIGEWPLPSTPSGRDVNNGGERLKLDLSNIQRNSDRNGGLVKREKIAFFDKECSKVADHVYLGGDAVARDRDILKQHGITHILNCVGFVCPEYFKADFVYRTLWLQDSPTEDITSILYDVFDYFEDVREQGGRVFVHCCQGVSRSTSLVIAYLMWREGQSFDDAFQYVKAARGIADPNMGFACQLLQCQKRVHAFPLSPSSLVRMYRIAPHSPYDPLHLVPKMLNDPSPSALDSRGAFIVHIPSAMYVWIGKKCEMIMERDARGAVCQIVRYEKVQGPVVMIKEGEEPSFFWDAFSSLLPLMDKSSSNVDVVDASIKICPGNRIIDSYSVDFEIFQKAIMGGFVPPFASSETEQETHLPARESSWSVLRRKFISGNMKEFVSGVSIVYPDSLFIVEEQCRAQQSHSSASSLLSLMPSLSSSSSSSASSSSLSSLSSSSSSSSSSPPYLSPDSSSDASINSTIQSDSPDMSPSAASAERRGSLSKSLKLQMLTDDSQGREMPTNSLTNEQDTVTTKHDACSLSKSLETQDSLDSEEQDVMHDELKLQSPLGTVGSCHADAAFRKNSDLHIVNHHLGKEESAISNGTLENGMASSGFIKPIVYRWPSLEKVVTFGSDDFDSQSAFVVITSSSCPTFGKTGAGILYFWVGRLFNCNSWNTKLESNQKFGGLVEFDWKQASSDVISRLGLPNDIKIEIIKEKNEPAEFLSLLKFLSFLRA